MQLAITGYYPHYDANLIDRPPTFTLSYGLKKNPIKLMLGAKDN